MACGRLRYPATAASAALAAVSGRNFQATKCLIEDGVVGFDALQYGDGVAEKSIERVLGGVVVSCWPTAAEHTVWNCWVSEVTAS